MNHSRLLDPLDWRRSEAGVEFPLPTEEKRHGVFREILGRDGASAWPQVFRTAWAGSSFAEASRVATRAKRDAALDGVSFESGPKQVLGRVLDRQTRERHRRRAFSSMPDATVAQHRASALTDAGPDAVRDHGSRPLSGESRRA